MGLVKKVIRGKELQDKLLLGVNKMADSVGSTLGPGGRHVMLSDGSIYGGKITKDGVTVARAFGLEDPVEDLAVQFMKKVSEISDENVGDGTTTSMVLAQSMLKAGYNILEQGDNMYEFMNGMSDAVDNVLSSLEKYKHEIDLDSEKGVTEIENIARVSSNGDSEIIDSVLKAVAMVGNDGSIKVGASKSRETTVSKKEGISYDMGMLSPFMVTEKSSGESILHDAYVLVTDIKLNSLHQLKGVLDNLEGKPLFMITDEIDKDVLFAFVANLERYALKGCIVKAPGFGNERKEYLEDIAAVTGAKAIFKGVDKEPRFDMSILGTADKIVTTFDNFTIIGGNGKEEVIKERIKSIKKAYEEETDGYYKDRYNERYAKLKSGIAVINIGATSELEMWEKKYRFMDAIYSVKAALDGGYIVGGGIALMRVSKSLSLEVKGKNNSYNKGYAVVVESLVSPIIKLYDNIGLNFNEDIDKLGNDFEFGRNLKTMEFGNLVELGVIDAFNVVENSIRNSVSIVSTLLTTDTAVYAVGEKTMASIESNGFLK